VRVRLGLTQTGEAWIALIGVLLGALVVVGADRLGAATVDDAPTRLRSATVSIWSDGCGQRSGTGVRMANGRILTVSHVVAGGRLTIDGQPLADVTVDPSVDLAYAEAGSDDPAGLVIASGSPVVGDRVTVAGRSTGSTEIRPAIVTGWVGPKGPADPPIAMQLDVPASPGDSGGGVVNERGELVGLIYATEFRTGRALVQPVGGIALTRVGTPSVCQR